MFTNKHKPRGRGRPPGRTAEGIASRTRLFGAAVELIGERGYDGTTLRDVAARAGVSPALLYRYFPNKRAIVLALYDQLSDDFAVRAKQMPAGPWGRRVMYAIRLSFDTLGPHRRTLRALAPVLIGDTEEGVFSRNTAFSRLRVQTVFQDAVKDATGAPVEPLASAVGRLLYFLHLGLIMWWLLDRSPAQRATTALLDLLPAILPAAALALRLPLVRRFVRSVDALLQDALLDAGAPGDFPHHPSWTNA